MDAQTVAEMIKDEFMDRGWAEREEILMDIEGFLNDNGILYKSVYEEDGDIVVRLENGKIKIPVISMVSIIEDDIEVDKDIDD